jgi:hypothetical protein
MPYVRQRTRIALAPRIRGLSLRESPWGFRGMGQAPCPSDQQLQGITDCSDPCQAGYGACAGAVPNIPALPVSTNINPLDYGSSNIPLIQGTPSTLSSWLQQNQTTILIGGGLLFVIALMRGMK